MGSNLFFVQLPVILERVEQEIGKIRMDRRRGICLLKAVAVSAPLH